ncbi:E3 ubiquitin-protein ligase CHFR [Biomphalaria glabrata]
MNDAPHEKVWGQLLSITNIQMPVIPIINNKFVIGRNSDCDLPHVDNKLVSSKHCYIERADDGTVWLYDTSTNGTLLNLKFKLVKGERRQLHHGDEIHIIHKKNDTENDIGYVFEDLKELDNEPRSDDTEEYSFNNNATFIDESVNYVVTTPETKRQSSEDIGSTPCKKLKTENSNSNSKDDISIEENEKDGVKMSTPDRVKEKLNGQPNNSKSSVCGSKEEEDAFSETLVCSICQELLHDCISLQPCMHSFCSGCYSEWMDRSDECPSCRLKVERINKNHLVNNLVEAYLKLKPEKRRPEEELNELDMKNKITRDMLYPDKKIQQSFDYSDAGSQDSQADIQVVAPEAVGAAGAIGVPGAFGAHPVGLIFGAGTPFFGVGTTRAPQPVCRQCPNYVNNLVDQTINAVAAGIDTPDATTTPGPSTMQGASITPGSSTNPGSSRTQGPSTTGSSTPVDPDAKTFPPIPGYTCPPGGNHILCLCCMLPMPQRVVRHPTLPPQSCGICHRAFCHAYWGCRKVDCHGCLGKFKDMNFGKKCLTHLILDNPYESQVLANYMQKKGLSVKDVLAACLAKMVVGDYVCINQALFVSGEGINTPVCYSCGLRNFKDLAYFYRRDIPESDLPDEVKSRPNCHWGRNCRTQRNKPDHSKRFNHICEQSRTL